MFPEQFNLLCIRSKTQVEGNVRANENLHNILVSELHRARQFQKFTAARSSRMFGWMSAQETFLNSKDKGASKEDAEGSLLPSSVMRPICSDHQQVLLFQEKNDGGIITYELGVVFSVFRGSVSKAASTPRRLKVSVTLGINAPVDAVARVLVLKLEKIDDAGGNFAVSVISTPSLLVPSECVVCEVPFAEYGEKHGKMFFNFSEATMKKVRDIQDGKTTASEIFSVQTAKKSQVPKAHEPISYDGFDMGSFPKGPAGSKNIKLFLKRLPEVYGPLNLLNADGLFKVGGSLHTWDSICTRSCLWFDTIMDGKDKKNFSNGVYHKLAQLSGRFDFRIFPTFTTISNLMFDFVSRISMSKM